MTVMKASELPDVIGNHLSIVSHLLVVKGYAMLLIPLHLWVSLPQYQANPESGSENYVRQSELKHFPVHLCKPGVSNH